ncbi:unnamed protein product [Closterium sp. NIES-65]|nr:unnamed protein product [Closterium sp. NIES-65]
MLGAFLSHSFPLAAQPLRSFSSKHNTEHAFLGKNYFRYGQQTCLPPSTHHRSFSPPKLHPPFPLRFCPIDHAFWEDYSEEEHTRLNEDEQSTARSPRASLGFSPLRPTKPVSQPRSNTPTPSHVMGARAAVTTATQIAAVSNAAVKTASVKTLAMKSVAVKAADLAAKGMRASAAAPAKAAAARSVPTKPAAAAAKGTPAKVTRVTPAATSSVVVNSSPVGSVATKVAGEKAREQGNGRAAHTAVRGAVGKAALRGVEAAGGHAAGVGSGLGRGGGGATLIPKPGQSRAEHTAAAAKAVQAAPHITHKPAAPAAAVAATLIPKPCYPANSGIPKPHSAEPKGRGSW